MFFTTYMQRQDPYSNRLLFEVYDGNKELVPEAVKDESGATCLRYKGKAKRHFAGHLDRSHAPVPKKRLHWSLFFFAWRTQKMRFSKTEPIQPCPRQHCSSLYSRAHQTYRWRKCRPKLPT